jgi:hypothetical protein
MWHSRVVATAVLAVLCLAVGGTSAATVPTASAATAPTLKVSPVSGAAGTSAGVAGAGFANRQAVSFTWDGQPAQAPTVRTASNGSFQV